MKSTEQKELSFPVHGMSCSGCAANIEKALNQLPGVSQTVVNLHGNQVRVTYDPNRTDLLDFQDAIMGAGYSVPTTETTLQVKGMTCLSCASHVQGALGDLPGVLNVMVHLNKGIAQVSSVSGMVTMEQMIRAVVRAGYSAAVHEDANQVTPEPPPTSVSKDGDDGYTWRFKNLIRKS